MSNNTCNICCENYTDTVRQKISCFNCDFASCKTCIKTYLEGQVVDLKENHCMNCKVSWDGNFVIQNINPTFYRKIEKIEFNNYFDKEKLLLPSTQPFVEARVRRNNVIQEIRDLKEERTRLKQELEVIKRSIYAKERQLTRGDIDVVGEGDDETERKTNYICKCPSEDCRGFVNRNHKCGICGTEVCKDCQTVLEDEHKCDENIIETVKMLKQDSKQCPSCHTLIFKIEGCDQMFCTQCNTAFSWKRGTIETGPVHNPHFFEWQRRTGGMINRNPRDIQCGGLPEYSDIPGKLYLDHIYQLVMHIRHVEIHSYDRQPLTGNQDLRLQYLMNELTEEKWRHTLGIRFKKSKKNTDILGLLNMFMNAASSIFNNIVYHSISNTTPTQKMNSYQIEKSSFGNLRNYYNEEMHKISIKCNNTVVPFIGTEQQDERTRGNWKIVKSAVKPI